ncbi:hypothetical protein QN386_22390 [Pseudomonas sp. CCI3.2]|uniref:hypothetical protein n=1 Tax=unclassified Pseudomonas TaxID=196821 RepID=UPI002B22DE00|nr:MULTISPECIES: hypothetical protein [unclassified Pseudomonas]MEB0078047.1 hypothetical protein [Pseudomonas sp. MH10out]MEB0104054.1 hypothetical protein [Pseudomonas sp. CCI3.2]
MTPEQKVKYLILDWASKWDGETLESFNSRTGEEVEAAYDELVEADGHWDAKSETREGEVETELPADGGRHYEANSVAAQLPDKSWVGWTYYYGGGKHSDPDSIEWMEDAYDLTCAEEEKVVTVRTFTKPA